ncbi:MAG: hypothetical protein WCG04_00790 [Alphaproteobacteria bacterium]
MYKFLEVRLLDCRVAFATAANAVSSLRAQRSNPGKPAQDSKIAGCLRMLLGCNKPKDRGKE